ncbi:MAG: cupin domain-containing protein [Gemmatimonadota bacterium]|nr:cupin domain-containing protein [Gemmatimonadota bacterium]
MSVETANLGSVVREAERHGQRFELRRGDLGGELGLRKLSIASAVLPPGKADGAYRFHLVVENAVLVLGGELRIRLGGAEYALGPGDVVALPARASSAWQLLGRSDRPVHLLIAATACDRDVIGLPDSGKRVYRVRPDGEDGDAEDVVLRGDRVAELYDGEPVGEPLGPAPEAIEPRDPRITNVDDVAWEAFGRPPFRGERKRLSRAVGAERLGYSLYRLQPGQRPFPFHFHQANEEFFYVRSGYGQLRTVDGARELRPGDAFGCPVGIEGGHGILNTGDGPLEYFALSTMIEPEVIEYPDSDKLYVMVGSPPGGDARRRIVDRVFRRGDTVEYEEGEA